MERLEFPKVALAYITRKCSEKCIQCRLWKKEDNDEREAEYWVEMAKKMDEKDGIIGFYGGEPLEYDGTVYGLLRLVKMLESPYFIISSCNKLHEESAEQFVLNGLKNWSASVDGVSDVRSLRGLYYLKLFQKLGVPDLLAEMTIYPGTVVDVWRAAEILIENDIWVAISFGMSGRTPNYDSFSQTPLKWTDEDITVIKSFSGWVRRKYREGAKIHGFHLGYLNMWLDMDFLEGKWKCEQPRVLHADSDGKMRVCRDIAGTRVRSWDMLDVFDNFEKFTKDWYADYDKYCVGCNWSCAVWASLKGVQFKH